MPRIPAKLRPFLCVALIFLWPFQLATGGEQNAIKSCYEILKISMKPTVAQTGLFVLVDQTTVLDDGLRKSTLENVRKFLVPGNAFSIIVFSAYIQNHYTDVVVSGHLDPLLTNNARDEIPKNKLRELDSCLSAQVAYARKLSENALHKAFGKPAENIAKSDIVASLQEIAKSTIQPSSSKRRVILVVSDMLENSSITSFYAKNSLRMIDPILELKKFEKENLLADFGDAEVYVLGAGIIPIDGKSKAVSSYRSPELMQRLKAFWGQYFQVSRAKLIEFGQPSLLGEMK